MPLSIPEQWWYRLAIEVAKTWNVDDKTKFWTKDFENFVAIATLDALNVTPKESTSVEIVVTPSERSVENSDRCEWNVYLGGGRSRVKRLTKARPWAESRATIETWP
jgi:hypothetical protein